MALFVKANPKIVDLQTGCQYLDKRKIPPAASDHEQIHGLDSTSEIRSKQEPVHSKPT